MKKEALHFTNKKHTPKNCKGLKRPSMKKETSRFENKKHNLKNARGSKDLRWKKSHRVSRIRNASQKMQVARKTSEEKEAPCLEIHPLNARCQFST
jgi:hypothetical protein